MSSPRPSPRAGGRTGSALADPDTASAIRLTLLVAAISVPLNAVFGLAASWAIAKFDFRGKAFLLTLLDLPFSISPVVAGLMFVLLFGMRGLLGPWLEAHHFKVIFALPGMVMATIFVTFPYVARELIPVMQAQGREQEEASLTLGAGGWKTFWHVTLPSVKWGFSTESFSATPAPWANLAPSPSFPAISPGKPIPCPCAWKSSTTNLTRPPRLPSPLSWPCWPWRPSF